MAIIPAWCVSRCRTESRSFPACANSGQYVATGASRSTRPSSIRRSTAIAETALPTDHTATIPSRGQGVVRAASR